MDLTIGFLYGDCMNIYGDTGNIITLKNRAEWRGIKVKIKNLSLKDKFNQKIDLYFFGGGQDQSQITVSKDLQKGKAESIKEAIEKGIPLLSICGGYQLLGEYYQPFDGPQLTGAGIFKAYTKASSERMIGNCLIQLNPLLVNEFSNEVPDSYPTFAVGFENHSGKTYLLNDTQPLGKIIKGYGNNGEDKTEGCMYKNALGCYLHGSLLPKNPLLADWFLKKALEVKYKTIVNLKPLDDEIEKKAHNSIIKKLLHSQ